MFLCSIIRSVGQYICLLALMLHYLCKKPCYQIRQPSPSHNFRSSSRLTRLLLEFFSLIYILELISYSYLWNTFGHFNWLAPKLQVKVRSYTIYDIGSSFHAHDISFHLFKPVNIFNIIFKFLFGLTHVF